MLKANGEDFTIDDEPGFRDDHNTWNNIEDEDEGCEIGNSGSYGSYLNDQWNQMIKAASDVVQGATKSSVPPSVRDLLAAIAKGSGIDWKKELSDFLQLSCCKMDYSYMPPDKRFTYMDIFMPAYQEIEDYAMENIWFVIDTSGSVSDTLLLAFFQEMKQVLLQIGKVKGKLSFFSGVVSEPMPFETLEDLNEIQAVSNGSTSISAIFQYMAEHMHDELPSAVIIFTDGYDQFPDKKESLGVPVLWVISEQDIHPDWGRVIHYGYEEE